MYLSPISLSALAPEILLAPGNCPTLSTFPVSLLYPTYPSPGVPFVISPAAQAQSGGLTARTNGISLGYFVMAQNLAPAVLRFVRVIFAFPEQPSLAAKNMYARQGGAAFPSCGRLRSQWREGDTVEQNVVQVVPILAASVGSIFASARISWRMGIFSIWPWYTYDILN